MKKMIDSFLQRGGACLTVCILLLALCLPLWPKVFSQTSIESSPEETQVLAQNIHIPNPTPLSLIHILRKMSSSRRRLKA